MVFEKNLSMQKKHIFTSILILSSHVLLFTQSRNLSYYGNNARDHLLIKQQDMVGRVTNEDIDGSPYLVDSFTESIIYTDKTLYKGVPMRYNIHEGYMEFKENDITYILDPKTDLKKIELNNQQIVVEPFDDRGSIKLGFFILVDSTGVKLLKKKNIRFQERIPAKALQSAATPPAYIPMPDEFYFRLNGQAAKPIHNLKKMIELFPHRQKDLLSYANRHHLKSNESDLKELWQYYQKLLSK